MQRTDWEDLGRDVRDLILAQAGPVLAARTLPAGLNSQLAVVLHTATGQVFVKGLRTDHPGVVRQHREAMINPHVLPLATQLRWQAEGAGWNLLAFDYLPNARHADYTPRSADLPAVVHALNQLQQIPCPDLPLKRAEQRWAAYLYDDAAAGLLAGDTLLHTDFNPLNVLMDSGTARIIDWAWPTRGAAFIDPACFLLRLMLSGHTAAQAQAWAAQCDSWASTPDNAISAFALACARLYAEIAQQDPQPWKQRLAAAAQKWAQHRPRARGASLARLEAIIALQRLTTRFPSLALDGEVTWNGRINLRGPAHLPISVSKQPVCSQRRCTSDTAPKQP